MMQFGTDKTEQELEQVELSIDDAKQKIELRDALNRLHGNKDFQKVIMEGYVKEEASRIALCMADGEFADRERQEALQKMSYGIGAFFQYMKTIGMMANMAESALADHEQAKQELMRERGLEDDDRGVTLNG